MKAAEKIRRGEAIDYSSANCCGRFVKKINKSEYHLNKSQEGMIKTLITSGLSRKKLASLILSFDDVLEGASARVTIKKEFTSEAFSNKTRCSGTQTAVATVSKFTQTELEFSK